MAPIADGKDAKGNWERTIYIDLIVDGEIIDLNRIPLPADTPIIDERFAKNGPEKQSQQSTLVEDREANPAAVKPNAKPWTVARPHAVKPYGTKETAELRADHSVQMSLPSPGGSLPELTFKFVQATTVRTMRLELLPDTRFADRRLGRIPEKKTMLFEVEARRVDAEGKSQRLEWDSCTSTSLEDGEGWVLCDAATDTGWEVPPLSAAATSHELIFAFSEPIVLPADGQLVVVLDSGAGGTGTIARFRVSFAQ